MLPRLHFGVAHDLLQQRVHKALAKRLGMGHLETPELQLRSC